MSKATEYTGPGSRVQGPVPAKENGGGSELYMLVLRDIVERAEFGAKKYGHPLRETAGVDFATNAYQEVLDLLIYFRGEIELKRELNDLLYDAGVLIASASELVPGLPGGWESTAIRWRDRWRTYLSKLPANSRYDDPFRNGSLTGREGSGTLDT